MRALSVFHPSSFILHPSSFLMTGGHGMYAKRMSKLGTETAFEVVARARVLEAKGMDVVHLEIGEPDFNTPQNIVEAGIQALRDGWHHYGPAAGLPVLREAVAEHISQTRKIPVTPEQ